MNFNNHETEKYFEKMEASEKNTPFFSFFFPITFELCIAFISDSDHRFLKN